MSQDFWCDTQMVGSESGVNQIKAWIRPVLYQSCNGVRLFSCHTLGALVPTKAYLSIVVDNLHPFIMTV